MKLSKKAFTLIELLVVIAIISLLLAVIVPSLKVVKQQASAVICASNVKQIVTAWFNYAEANKSFICGADTQKAAKDDYDWVDGNAGDTVETEIEAIRRGTLFPFYENPELVHCPMDARYRKSPLSGTRLKGGYRTYSLVCTLNSAEFRRYPNWFQDNCSLNAKDQLKKFTEIVSPGTKFILVEENDPRGLNVNGWAMKLKDPPGMIDPFAVFHNMRSILGFADGHAIVQRWQDDRTEKLSKEIGENTHAGSMGNFGSRPDEETNPLNQDFRWLADHVARSR